ncbi:hypothetical protein FCV25MIE_01860 [Fagus crenata]
MEFSVVCAALFCALYQPAAVFSKKRGKHASLGLLASEPKGSLCNLNVKVDIGLPPDAVNNIVTDPDNKRVFKNIKGEDIIVVLPWEEWWDFELDKDDSNPHIALLPLHPDTRAKFNETAAWEYARSMDGKPRCKIYFDLSYTKVRGGGPILIWVSSDSDLHKELNDGRLLRRG